MGMRIPAATGERLRLSPFLTTRAHRPADFRRVCEEHGGLYGRTMGPWPESIKPPNAPHALNYRLFSEFVKSGLAWRVIWLGSAG